LLAVEDGFAAYDGGALELIVPVLADDGSLRMNDGKCDASGRFYASSMARDGSHGRGMLWRLDADLTVHAVVEGLTIGNGLAWSADGRTLHFIDTALQRVDRFDVDPGTGALANRRTAFPVRGEVGSPDGMCIDADDCLWVALFGGGAVHRYSPSGELLAVVDVPVPNVTSVAFGGANLDVLYITTARLSDATPGAGGLFAVAPGVTGPPPEYFGG
jgi:sugar lactone lactonase YvrE